MKNRLFFLIKVLKSNTNIQKSSTESKIQTPSWLKLLKLLQNILHKEIYNLWKLSHYCKYYYYVYYTSDSHPPTSRNKLVFLAFSAASVNFIPRQVETHCCINTQTKKHCEDTQPLHRIDGMSEHEHWHHQGEELSCYADRNPGKRAKLSHDIEYQHLTHACTNAEKKNVETQRWRVNHGKQRLAQFTVLSVDRISPCEVQELVQALPQVHELHHLVGRGAVLCEDAILFVVGVAVHAQVDEHEQHTKQYYRQIIGFVETPPSSWWFLCGGEQTDAHRKQHNADILAPSVNSSVKENTHSHHRNWLWRLDENHHRVTYVFECCVPNRGSQRSGQCGFPV